MKAYVIITGALFGVITIAHVVRATSEKHLATDPFYILLTLISAALCIWAGYLILRSKRSA